MNEHDIYRAGYKIGIDAAREIQNIERSGLMQGTPPVQATSFCNNYIYEAYSIDIEFATKLAEKDNDSIFKDGIEVGCLDYMAGSAVPTYRKVIKESNQVDTTDVNAINAVLHKAFPTTPENREELDLELNKLLEQIQDINKLYQ